MDRKSTECEIPVTVLDCRSVMAYSPLLCLKSTKEAEETLVIENLVSKSMTERPELTKDETLYENNPGEECTENVRKSLDSIPMKKRADLPRYSTIGSRRLDSIRFKEGSKSLKSYSLPRGSTLPTFPNQGIEAEIDEIFQKVF